MARVTRLGCAARQHLRVQELALDPGRRAPRARLRPTYAAAGFPEFISSVGDAANSSPYTVTSSAIHGPAWRMKSTMAFASAHIDVCQVINCSLLPKRHWRENCSKKSNSSLMAVTTSYLFSPVYPLATCVTLIWFPHILSTTSKQTFF